MKKEGINQQVQPNLIPNIVIPLIGQICIFLHTVDIGDHGAIIGNTENETHERYAKYLGLHQEGDDDAGCQIGDQQVSHDGDWLFGVISVSLELGDLNHDQIGDQFEDDHHNRN